MIGGEANSLDRETSISTSCNAATAVDVLIPAFNGVALLLVRRNRLSDFWIDGREGPIARASWSRSNVPRDLCSALR